MSRLLLLTLVLAQPCFAQFSQTLSNAAAKNPKAPVQAAVIPVEPPSQWTLSAGVQWRQIGEATLHTRSQAGNFTLPGLSGTTGSGPNGYVLPDSTGGAVTWNWGFDDPSQVQGNRLTITSGGGTTGSLTNTGGTHSEDLTGIGPYIELESPKLLEWKHIKVSATFGYSFVQDDTQSNFVNSLAVQQTQFVDVYDLTPALPLSGSTYHGSFNGPGPVISRTPISHTEAGGIDDIFTGTLQQSLEVRLHTLSFGPRMAMEFKRVRAMGSLGLAVNIADWKADVNESFTDSSGNSLGHWQAHNSGTEVLPGIYLQVGAQVRLTQRLILTASGRYDWSESLKGSVGKSDFDVKLGGWTAMLGLGWQF